MKRKSQNCFCRSSATTARASSRIRPIEIANRANIAPQATGTSQISTEAAETVNVSVEGEKVAEMQETPHYECPNYADYAFERGWSIENTDFDAHSGVLCMIHFDPTDEKYVCGCLWQISSDSPNYTEHRRFKTLKGAQNYGTKRMGMKLKYQTLTVHCPITPTEPPQSPETPQAAECIADTPKPREMAQKEPKQVIRNSRTTQQRTIKRFLIVQSVPRLAKCSTAHHIAGASKMVYSGIIPSGYAPPIRGDCMSEVDCQWLSDNR